MPHFSFGRRFAIAVSVLLFIVISWPSAILPHTVFAQGGLQAALAPNSGPSGTVVTTTGSGWLVGSAGPGDQICTFWDTGGGGPMTCTTLNQDGTFSVNFTVPSNQSAGQHTVGIEDLDASTNETNVIFTITTNTPTVLVQKVWTGDGNNNQKTSFAPGDVIRYFLTVTNSGSSTVTATFTFLATGPQQIFSWSGPAPVASGTEGFYSPSTIPSNAPAGTYTLTVSVTYNGASSSGQSTFTVRQVSTLSSSNYAGYGTVGSIYSKVRASWIVPTAICKGLRATTVAPWVGLGGLKGGQYIEQIGTESACFTNGTQIVPKYFAWYEMLPAPPQPLDNSYVVNANDVMSATVAYGGTSNGQGVFAFQLVDHTQNWTYYATQLGPTDVIARSSAEWIVEAPGIGPISTGTLTEFSNPIKFTACYVDDGSMVARGPTIEKFIMVINHPKGPRADTSDLGDNDTSFSIKWRHY